MKRQEGLQDSHIEAEMCPACLNEILIRQMGRILVCPSCEVVLLDQSREMVFDHSDSGDENDYKGVV